MKLTCVLLVLIGAIFAMATAANTTTAMPTTMSNMTTAMQTTLNTTTAMQTTLNSTTAMPTTTSNMTTAAQTTTPMMTTTMMPEETTFRLNNSNSSACILEQLQADFSIEYEMVNAENKTVKSMVKFVLPQEATVDVDNSACGSAASNGAKATMPMLTLVFDAPDLGNKFEQVFTMSANFSALSNITLALNHTDAIFPNSTQAGQLVMYTATLPSSTFMVSNGQSYLCNSRQSFKINNNANVTFSKVKVQTADITDNKFGNESQCPQDVPSTTNAPTTSPSPTPTPTPYPAPESWNITRDGKTCMLVNMSVEFNITYLNTKNMRNSTLVKIENKGNTSKSVCGNITSKFVLDFNNGWELTLVFEVDNKTSVYNNTNMMLLYKYDDHFVNPKKNGSATASIANSGITAAEGKYYSCSAVQQTTENVTFTLHDIKIQPFALKSNQTFGAEAPCPADEGFNNIVPIAVGCALAGLVIIVLIAYLIGRQRSSKSGYESV